MDKEPNRQNPEQGPEDRLPTPIFSPEQVDFIEYIAKNHPEKYGNWPNEINRLPMIQKENPEESPLHVSQFVDDVKELVLVTFEQFMSNDLNGPEITASESQITADPALRDEFLRIFLDTQNGEPNTISRAENFAAKLKKILLRDKK